MLLLSGKLSRAIQLGCGLLAITWPGMVASAQSSLGELAQRAAMLKPVPGDRVTMHVYGDPTMSDASTVDERGRIVLPRVGMIQADAYTAAELRDTVRARAATILREATVEVNVMRRIVVSGEVVKPGVYYAELTSSFGEMVAQAGGLRETGHSGKVYLVRGATRTAVKDWAADQSPAADLHSGDQILVGRKSWVALNIIPFAGLSMSAVTFLIALRQQLIK